MDSNEMLEKMIKNMPEKTGKSLGEWHEILRSESFTKHSESVNYLKKDFGLTHGFANTIVHLSKNENTSAYDLVSAQYQGKEKLIPIHDQLKKLISDLGNDVEFAAKKSYISVRRKKQFAIIQPSTKTRLDLGLNIKNQSPNGTLESAGSFNSMCTHRIRLESIAHINKECKEFLKLAYDQAG